MQKINRKDLVEVVAEEGHLSKKDARTAIDLVFGLIEKSILNGQEVNVTNFGVFTPKTKQGRDGTDLPQCWQDTEVVRRGRAPPHQL